VSPYLAVSCLICSVISSQDEAFARMGARHSKLVIKDFLKDLMIIQLLGISI
jgi:hypothetical protein